MHIPFVLLNVFTIFNRKHRLPIERISSNPPSLPSTQQLRGMMTAPLPSLRFSTKKKHQRSAMFTPYYDILQNDTIYAVRIVLPLMKPDTTKRLAIVPMLNHHKINISGSYIPSTLVGTECAKLLSLRQPLLPVIYAPSSKSGQFNLNIALPQDIRSDSKDMNIVHDSWGILISFPRIKKCHDQMISLTSCFGTANLKPTEFSLTSPTDTATTPSLTADQKDTSTEPPARDHVDASDPASILGLEIQLPGEKWGELYKGRLFQGVLTSFTEKDGYVVWFAKFDDCEEKFNITDLLDYKLVSQDQYDQLIDRCLPPVV